MATQYGEDLLLTWIRGMTGTQKQQFANFGLGHALDFHMMEINWNLLRAAASCWDRDIHAFKFGTNYLCPTIDEFDRILGAHSERPLIYPNDSCRKEIIEFFGMSNSAFPHYCYKNLICINRLALFFNEPNDSYQRLRALAFCVLGRYLLRYDGIHASTFLIEVVKSLENGAAIVPTILGELFDSLDSFDLEHRIKGSPYLLEVWLADHLRLMTPYPRENYTLNVVRSFLRGEYKIRSQGDTEEWLRDLPSVQIRWHLSHLGIGEHPLLCTGGHNIVSIMSLTRRSYCPSLFFRQFGFVKDIPTLKGKFFGPLPLSNDIMIKTALSWDKRERLEENREVLERPFATVAFKKWITSYTFDLTQTSPNQRLKSVDGDLLHCALARIDRLNTIIEEKDEEIAALRTMVSVKQETLE